MEFKTAMRLQREICKQNNRCCDCQLSKCCSCGRPPCYLPAEQYEALEKQLIEYQRAEYEKTIGMYLYYERGDEIE